MAGVLTLTLAACGGGSSTSSTPGSTPITISGTAATGAAISGGAVDVKCASGTGTATTNADGTYTVSIVGGTAPCLIKVSTTDASGATTDLFSAVEPGQTIANVTPLTQMVVASALGADPATVFNAGTIADNTDKLGTSNLTAAVETVKAVASNLGLDLTNVDPLKATLVAATDNTSGNAQDQAIDGLMAALSGAGLGLSNLTSVMQTTTGTGQASAAVSTLSTAAGTAGGTLSTSSLAGCPVARSGGYFYAGPGDTNLNKVVINFDAVNSFSITDNTTTPATERTIAPMKGWDFQSGSEVTIAQFKDTVNDPSSSQYTTCAFKITTALNETIDLHLSSSGLGAYASTSGAGLVLPVQKKLTLPNLAGSLYGVKFSKATTTNSKYMNRYQKLLIASDGLTAKGWNCTAVGDGLSCPADTDPTYEIFNISQAANGKFVFRDSSNFDHSIAIYVNNKGDRVAMAAYPTNGGDGFTFMSSRVSAMPLRAVGDTWSSWTWKTVNANTAGALTMTPDFNNYSVVSVTGANLVRNDGTANDTLVYNDPLAGMAHKLSTASPLPVTSGAYVFTGPGWSVSASDNPNAPTGAKHFFNISVGLK